VVAIDFSPHTESMQTDALLETGMRFDNDKAPNDCCGSGPKNMACCMATVCVMVILVIVFSNM
jgi:hypothetical protein